MGEALTIRVRRDRGYAVVAVAGEVDIATVTWLRESLFELAAGGRRSSVRGPTRYRDWSPSPGGSTVLPFVLSPGQAPRDVCPKPPSPDG